MSTRQRPGRARSAPLHVEPLEGRTLPAAAVTATLTGGMFMIEGTDGPDNISLWHSGGLLQVVDHTIGTAAGQQALIPASDVRRIVVNGLGGDDRIFLNQDRWGADPILTPATIYGGDGNDLLAGGWGDDILYGGDGNDTLLGNVGADSLRGGAGDDSLLGEAGDDVLAGGDGNDTLGGAAGCDQLNGGTGDDWLFGDEDADSLHGEDGHDVLGGGAGRDLLAGGAGNDWLFGNESNDWLSGEGEWDVLRGGGGSDVLDAGGRGEDVDGEDGADLDVYGWDAGGAQAADVAQRAAPVCGFLAALGAVAHAEGATVANGIAYVGGFTYRVSLFRASPDGAAGQWVTQDVYFDGTLTSADPQPTGEGKFWPILYQRAWLQERAALGLSDLATPAEALTAVTGRPATGFLATDEGAFRQALAEGRLMVASSHPTDDAVGPKVVSNHGYAILGVDGSGNILLRNPWGIDGGPQASGDPNDAIVALSWPEYAQSMLATWVC
ncbi:MAG: hypothetical protein IT429_05615 [Gemmataceae bacterium]|nr:hypothetical protein [Gemmataceae bacterium]